VTRAEIEKRAEALTRIGQACGELSTSAVQMVAEVARSLRDGEALAREAARLREEKTAVEWRS
jgi:hypothetical protein